MHTASSPDEAVCVRQCILLRRSMKLSLLREGFPHFRFPPNFFSQNTGFPPNFFHHFPRFPPNVSAFPYRFRKEIKIIFLEKSLFWVINWYLKNVLICRKHVNNGKVKLNTDDYEKVFLCNNVYHVDFLKRMRL